MPRWSIVLATLAVAGCSCKKTDGAVEHVAAGPDGGLRRLPVEQHATSHSPKIEPLAVCHAEGKEPLEAARAFYDQERYDEALACAAQASAFLPDEPAAFSEKGAALSALGRFDEAQLAYARALALDPDHADALLGAAHLYGVSLPSTRERDELASIYAEHGLELAEESDDDGLQAQFALISAMAFNDLGQAADALRRAEQVLAHDAKSTDAQYERAMALFELCRFADAKVAFERLFEDGRHGPHAHHHLGLLLEREGRWDQAEAHFAQAQQASPADFPAPVMLSEAEFKAEVARAVDELPADMRKDLGGIPVTAEEIPRDDDLTAGDPPLSPAILGLFRGPPLKDRCTAEDTRDGGPCRSVALYRRNLARAVKTREELVEQIRVTLLHEVGHLRGEDDYELAARGLE